MADGGDQEHEQLRARIATDNGIALYRQYSEADAARFIGIHPATLKRTRLDGRIGFLRKGPRSITYFGYQIVDFLIESIECPEPQKTPSSLAKTGSGSAPAPRLGTGISGTPKLDAQDAYLLARKTLKKPSKR